MNKFFTTLLFLASFACADAQGWERILSGGGQDEARALAKTPDGGYVVAGPYGAVRLAVIKTDADGFPQWTKTYLSGIATGEANAITMLPDSSLLITGLIKPNGLFSQSDLLIIKTDESGNQIWQKNMGGTGDDAGKDVLLLPDGNVIIAGSFTQPNGQRDAWVFKMDGNGNVIWEKTFGEPTKKEKFNGITLCSNGEIALTGVCEDAPDRDVYVVRLDQEGSVIWVNTYGFDFNPNSPSSDDGNDIAEAQDGGLVIAGRTTTTQGQNGGLLLKITNDGDSTPIWFQKTSATYFNAITRDGNGGYVITGMKEVSPTQEDMFIMRTDAEGDDVWQRTVGKNGPDIGNAILMADDGGAVVAGIALSSNFLQGDSYFYLVKTTADGVVFSDYLQGNVFHDFNLDCTKSANEPGLEDWIIKIEGQGFFETQYIAADANGNYQALVDTGFYRLTLITPNDYWMPCLPVFTANITGFYDTVKVDMPVHAAKACPRNEVAIATPILRRCAENVYTVRYCNSGTIPSTVTKIEVALDPFLTVTGSSIPWESAQDNVYTFNIGYLNTNDCGDFTVTAFLNCDSTIIGQTHCATAHIFPDTFCSPNTNWNGAYIVAKAKCDGDSVHLGVQNRGIAPLNTTLGFIIAEDIVLRTAPGDPTFTFGNLDPAEEIVLWSAPANGKTFRIIAEQAPGYPGVSYPTAAIEGCVTDTATAPISTGFYTMYPEDDADAFIATDCQESNDITFNPTFLKRGHPKGFDVNHHLSPQTDLDYLIRFANTGMDTVHQVIVRDTLSAFLDPSTVHPGAASHAYDFTVYAGGVVQFTIPNLNLLPGSSASEAATSGYVKFHVSQKQGLPCGTKIFNRAAVYFDYNAPAQTNQTWHTTGCDWVEDSIVKIVLQSQNIYLAGAGLKVYPNPFVDETTFEVTGIQAKTYSLDLFDIQGRRLSQLFSNHPTFRLYRHQLPEGILFYRLAADGMPIASGKLLVQD